MKTIGQRIKERRTELKLTQRALAKLVNVAHVTISQWENDQTSPKGDNLFQLSDALGKDPAWIQRGNDSGDSDSTAGAVILSPEQRQLIDLFNRLPSSERQHHIDALRDTVEGYDKLFNDIVKTKNIDELIAAKKNQK